MSSDVEHGAAGGGDAHLGAAAVGLAAGALHQPGRGEPLHHVGHGAAVGVRALPQLGERRRRAVGQA